VGPAHICLHLSVPGALSALKESEWIPCLLLEQPGFWVGSGGLLGRTHWSSSRTGRGEWVSMLVTLELESHSPVVRSKSWRQEDGDRGREVETE
jgi:hypothetical protein